MKTFRINGNLRLDSMKKCRLLNGLVYSLHFPMIWYLYPPHTEAHPKLKGNCYCELEEVEEEKDD